MNIQSKITAAIDAETWEPRFRAALGTTDEAFLLMKLSAEMEAVGEPLWAQLYDLATEQDAECRAEFIAEINDSFARERAEREYDEAAYGYEVRTGRDAGDACSPYWDRSAWIDRAVVRELGA